MDVVDEAVAWIDRAAVAARPGVTSTLEPGMPETGTRSMCWLVTCGDRLGQVVIGADGSCTVHLIDQGTSDATMHRAPLRADRPVDTVLSAVVDWVSGCGPRDLDGWFGRYRVRAGPAATRTVEHATHDRWLVRRNREADPDMHRQCHDCRWFMLLAGPAGLDWGVCANPRSRFDGTVRFEHDGCAQFVEASL